MYVITWSIVSIDISAENSPTFLQCLTALLSELWTLIFLHNYEKLIFWCSFSACPPGKAHTETQSCYSIGRQFKAVVVLDSLQGLVFECGTLVKNDCAPSKEWYRRGIRDSSCLQIVFKIYINIDIFGHICALKQDWSLSRSSRWFLFSEPCEKSVKDQSRP